MTAQDNLAMHSRWTEAENAHDLSRHDEFLHPDIEVDNVGGERVVGITAYRDFMERTFEALPDFYTVLDDQFATDDRVVCTWRVTATHEGDLFGFPPTGRRIEWAGVSVWEIELGKARRGRIFMDVAGLMAQMTS